MSITGTNWPSSESSRKQSPILRKSQPILIPITTSITWSTRKHHPGGNIKGPRRQDDWTRIKDPKEKKRVQNRVAQRTYRNRVKARLLDLQAKVEAHERNEKELEKQIEHAQGFSTLAEPTPMAIDSLLQSPASVISTDEQNLMQYTIENPADAIHSDSIRSVATIFDQQQPHYVTNDPLAMSHTVFQSNGMLSPRAKSASPNFTGNDNLPFQKPQFTQSGHQPQQPQQSNGLLNAAAHHEYPENAIVRQGDHTPLTSSSFPESQSNEMEAIIDAYVNSWNREDIFSAQSPPESDLTRLPRVIQDVESALYIQQDGLPTQNYTATTAVNISECANFSSLNNTGVPKDVLVSNTESSIDGLKALEVLLAKESATARESLFSKLGPLLESQDLSGRPCPGETIKAVKRSIQHEVPRSWALLTALASTPNQPWQHNQSNSVLAAILLIELNGKVASEKLLKFIASFL